jgi:uncharacterized protein YtpQ (UPF0354 family)
MSVQEQGVIDILAHDPATKEVKMIMVEGRDWTTSPEALSQLNNKFASYADYILSGNLTSQNPQYVNCPVCIELHHFHPIPASVTQVLQDWAGKLSGANATVWTKAAVLPPTGILQKLLAKLDKPQPSSRTQWPASSNSSVPLVTHAQFVEDFITALRKTNLAREIQVVDPSHIKTTAHNGNDGQIFLDNVRAQYWASPADKEEIIRKFVSALDNIHEPSDDEPVQAENIVPVIKDKGWMDEINQSLKIRGAKKELKHVHEPYNEELAIVYAEDTPKNMRYLTPDNLAELDVTLPELRKLAVANLERILQPPNVEGGNGVFRIRAGGDYDASLLLLADLWELGKIPVKGNYLVAIPARDWLLVTGSRDVKGIQTLKDIVQKITASAPYRLTSKLFIYRDGTFVVWNE